MVAYGSLSSSVLIVDNIGIFLPNSHIINRTEIFISGCHLFVNFRLINNRINGNVVPVERCNSSLVITDWDHGVDSHDTGLKRLIPIFVE